MMPKENCLKMKTALVWLLTGLLVWAVLSWKGNLIGTVHAQPENRTKEARPKHRKLAPDLEETLDWSEQAGSASDLPQTLGQVRRRKATATNASSPASKTQRIIVNLNHLANEIALQASVQRVGGRLHRVHPNLNVATMDVPVERVRELAAEPTIEYVSPDRPLVVLGHLETTTGAEQARALAQMNGVSDLDGTGVGLAIIDSGIDSNHKLIRQSAGHPGIVAATDFITVDARTDRFGHGTFIAAVAAGSDTLKSGLYEGIAPSVNLISLKVLGDDGAGLTSSLIAAIDWCIYNRATYKIRVINLSIGTVAKDSYLYDPLCLAARRAHAAGILVVAAAGNEGKDRYGNKLYGGIHSPGIDPSVLTVGAANTFNTDQRSDDRIASYSSRGPTRGYYTDSLGVKHYDNLIKPDLVAPGNRLISALSRNPDGKDSLNNLVLSNPVLVLNTSTKIEDRLMLLSGTSVAAPVVTGAAALLFELNPNFTPNLVKAILMYSAQPLAGYNTLEQGAGLINIDGAVRIARLIRSNPTTLTNGSSMLTNPILAPQTSVIVSEICPWGQSVITNYCSLYGSNLMALWQGVYGRNYVLADATKVVNGTIQQVPGLLSTGVLNSGGVSVSNGGIVADDRLLAKGVVFADGVTYASGVVFADGRITADSASLVEIMVKAKVVVPGD
ncbi:MAG TPA: S8 family peptidase [Blastocatellia bacterium]|nr:S8 family peptidase [Blastocatellia bacterium]